MYIYIKYSRNFDCFVVDLLHLHLTSVTFCVLFVIDLFGYLNVVPNSNLPRVRFFVYCICIILWHSHLMIWKFLKQNVLFPKSLNWVQHWVSWIGLFVNNSKKNRNNTLTNESSWPDSGQILCHQYGISIIEKQTSFLWNIPRIKDWEEMPVFVG